jgi:hypothetical protein
MRRRDANPMNRESTSDKPAQLKTPSDETKIQPLRNDAALRSKDKVGGALSPDRKQPERQMQVARGPGGGPKGGTKRKVASRRPNHRSPDATASDQRAPERYKGSAHTQELAEGQGLGDDRAAEGLPNGHLRENAVEGDGDGTSPHAYWDRVFKKLRSDAQSTARAMRWSPSLEEMEKPGVFENIASKALDDYLAGRFLLDQMGADRLLDPANTGMLLGIRRGLIEESEATSTSDIVLIDMAVTAFGNAMRLQSVVGNMCLILEADLFGQRNLSAIWKDEYRRGRAEIKGVNVEVYIAKLRDELLPLVDRCQSAARANILAIREKQHLPSVFVDQSKPFSLPPQN